MSYSSPDMSTILMARKRLAGKLVKTPVKQSNSLSQKTGADVWLKCEHHQKTGSFKFRGALNAVLNLDEAQKAKGVVGVSTGNHGRGLAHAAKLSGVACVICMSKLVPANKVDGIRSEGANVRIIGESQDEAQIEVDRLVREEGMTMLPPFDHSDIISGQGTLGLEMLEELPRTETLIIPLSGGGLISGVAIAAKALNPKIRVIGVSMERGAAMHASQTAGKPVEVEELQTLADSLGGGIGLDNRHTFHLVRELVDDIILLDEDEIAAGLAHAYWRENEVVEGSGSVAIGAILADKIDISGPTLCLLSGKNIDMKLHHQIISQILSNGGTGA